MNPHKAILVLNKVGLHDEDLKEEDYTNGNGEKANGYNITTLESHFLGEEIGRRRHPAGSITLISVTWHTVHLNCRAGKRLHGSWRKKIRNSGSIQGREEEKERLPRDGDLGEDGLNGIPIMGRCQSLGAVGLPPGRGRP